MLSFDADLSNIFYFLSQCSDFSVNPMSSIILNWKVHFLQTIKDNFCLSIIHPLLKMHVSLVSYSHHWDQPICCLLLFGFYFDEDLRQIYSPRKSQANLW